MGAFSNHVDNKGWVGGQPNGHDYPRWVGGYCIQCPRGQMKLRNQTLCVVTVGTSKVDITLIAPFKSNFDEQ